ncbi:MAG: hypothetical protein J6K41_04460 [Paraprevotella sp.]|nr:hypothetical protein [Paraprevotella sp.]
MDIPIASQNIRFPGYGMFWVANSISSTLMGWNNRRLQEKAHERTQEFQLEMERARNLTEDRKMQEEIAFKRRMMAVSRQYRQEESAVAFNTQMKAVELQSYLQHCWPLDPQLPYVLLQETEKGNAVTNSRLNVVLMRTPLLPQKKYGGVNELDMALYNNMEYSIMQEDVPFIGDLKYRKDACVKADVKGGNASIMNIHFLMSQLPTLVVVPQYDGDKMNFKGAVWEPQAARPFIRTLFGIKFSPEDALASNDYRQEVIEIIHASISIITGAVRDSYMLLTQGKAPTLPVWLNDNKHQDMKMIVKSEDGIQRFMQQERENILEALDESKTPRLLEVFSKEDIRDIKEQVKSSM